MRHTSRKGFVEITPRSQQEISNRTSRVAILDEFQGQALARVTPFSELRVLGTEDQIAQSR